MKQFDVVLVGCGVIAHKWMDFLTQRDDVRILALADFNEANIRVFKEKYKLNCHAYASINDALAHEKPNLICDLTYVTAHRDIVVRALEYGCDVLGEKPMCFSPAEAADMLSAVKSTGRRYIVMQNRRHLPQANGIGDFVRSGIMGKPVFVCTEIFVNADMASIRNRLDYPQLRDNNVHTFDQARNFANANAVACYYKSFNPAGSKYIGDAAGSAIFEMDNGAVFSFNGYNGAEGMHTTWESHWRICCERGTLQWDGATKPVYEVAEEMGRYVYERHSLDIPSASEEVSHQLALAEIFDALKTGRPSRTECTDNIYSIAMVFAAMESIKRKSRVEFKIISEAPFIVFD
jgi:predicted dehydrogenase